MSNQLKVVTPMRAGAPMAPIMPTTFDEAIKLSRGACMAGLLKPTTTGWGDNKTIESGDAMEMRGAMTILQGLEIGMPPMQSLQLIALINGKMTVHSEGIPGLLWAKAFKLKEWIDGTGDERVAHCVITRPDGTEVERTFSVYDAKKAGLWSPDKMVTRYGKNKPNDSPWFKYDYRMLKARALGFAARDGAADALRGIWVREEAEDHAQMRDITPAPASAISLDDFPDDTNEPTEAEASQEIVQAAQVDEPEGTDAEAMLSDLEKQLESVVGNKAAVQRVGITWKDRLVAMSSDDKIRAVEMIEAAKGA